ncbi:hypothetical protein MMC27_004134 [Xylographa pallens]|nr:hypothetical protein [Xylographa pallens]
MPSSEKKEYVSRHLACIRCRQKKVKCDGGKPLCKRCTSGAATGECSYKISARQRHQERDRSSLGSIASSISDSAETIDIEEPETLVVPDDLGQILSDTDFPAFNYKPSDIMVDETLQQDFDIEGGCFAPPYTATITSQLSDDKTILLYGYLPLGMNMEIGRMSLNPGAALLNAPNLPREPMEMLYASKNPLRTFSMLIFDSFSTYFTSCQTSYHLFDNQERLSDLMQESSYSSTALKYAICAHAAPACPQFSTWAMANLPAIAPGSDYDECFYLLARTSIGHSDIEHKVSSPSLQSLQSTILIALYELQHADFGRAWLTVSRAIWLTQALQLHAIDSEHAPSIDAASLEESRKALWAANSLIWFLSLGGRMIDLLSVEEVQFTVPKLRVDISTLLPRPEDKLLSSPGLRISNVFRQAAQRPLSVQEGFCTAAMLGPRIVAHIKAIKHANSPGQEPYHFWTVHHRLEEAVRYVYNFTDMESMSRTTCEATNSNVKLVLDLLLKAMSIVIHEASLKEMHRSTRSEVDWIRAAENAVLQRSLEIAHTARTSLLPNDAGTKVTVSWAIYVALQSLLRYQRRLGQLDHKLRSSSNSSSSNDASIWTSSDGTGSGRSGSMGAALSVTTTEEHCFSTADTAAAADALVSDSSTALRSTLLEWSGKSPLSLFFLNQITAESSSTNRELDERVVGLAPFATQGCQSGATVRNGFA